MASRSGTESESESIEDDDNDSGDEPILLIPFAVALSSDEPMLTDRTPFTVNVTFANSVTGLSADAFSVENGTAINLSGSGKGYSLEIVPSAQGQVKIDLPKDSLTDEFGNPNLAADQLVRTYQHSAILISGNTISEAVGSNTKFLDMNLDGIDDLVTMGAVVGGVRKVYVVFGKARSGFNDAQTIPVLDGSNGFTLTLSSSNTMSLSIRSDANGDGKKDLVMKTTITNCADSPDVYTVYSANTSWPASLNLSSGLNGSNGHKFTNSGCAGFVYDDIDGDDYPDLIRATTGAAGAVSILVKWGTLGGFPASFSMVSTSDTEIIDDVTGDFYSHILNGDLTGDGISELVLSSTQGGARVYILWGGTTLWSTSASRPASVALSTIDGSNGTYLSIHQTGTYGHSIADVNGDSVPDLITAGGYTASTTGATGAVSIFFGRSIASPWNASYGSKVNDSLFVIEGQWAGERGIGKLYPAADVNGDGIKDVLFTGSTSPKLYVVFGRSSWIGSPSVGLLRTQDFTGSLSTGFKVALTATTDTINAFDINADGIDDLILGDSSDANGGKLSVLFGKKSGHAGTENITSLDGTTGFVITGANNLGQNLAGSVGFGDFDGDGKTDMTIGAKAADHSGTDTGTNIILFGKSGGWSPEFEF